MNEARVRAVQVFNGWEGHFKKMHKAGWFPVEVNGIAQLFPSEADAKVAAYEAMTKHHFGDGILSDGERTSATRSKAEELFGAIFRRGRKIEVVRR
ncbi:hypothetical protein [Aquamicrobium defluvii]|uniref:Uncharacterized protein n=1 Tax=Aquamicrobium defluvii TaxID=69279 RepID=A0A4R6YEW7_9HYPH|nr:hypothetical protein [Aquamicrobium defluvii]TDR34684.1 hypothetical protein DES43_113115 [Aquamicrobium defluvii]